MKSLAVFLFLACMSCFQITSAAELRQEEARVVNVPPGTLGDAVESLARQVDVDVVYRGGALNGFSTAGVRGAFEPEAAFRKLLEGTPLVVTRQGSEFLIAQVATPTPRGNMADLLPAAEVPKPASTAASTLPSRAVCHRVSQGNLTRRYCGSAEQWSDLQARVGFQCRNEGRKDELCASAQEWNRLELIESTKQELTIRGMGNGPAAEGNRSNVTITPTVSAPVAAPPSVVK